MNKRISARKQTQARRKQKSCKTYEIKIDKSKLSHDVEHHLSLLFTEAKWFYNYCLSNKDINDSDTTIKEVPVKIKTKKGEPELYETREFKVLTGQMKQAIKTRLFGSLMSLHALKEQGEKVGRLKFKGRVNSIPLKQYEGTHFFNFEESKIRIQGLKSWLRVNGLEQIPPDCEIATAALVHKAGDYYLHINTFQEKQVKEFIGESIDIDFGCDTQLTFSNGVKVGFQVPISKRLKRLDRKIMKKKRAKSKKKTQDQIKRQKEYEKLTNQKGDIRKKLVSVITMR